MKLKKVKFAKIVKFSAHNPNDNDLNRNKVLGTGQNRIQRFRTDPDKFFSVWSRGWCLVFLVFVSQYVRNLEKEKKLDSPFRTEELEITLIALEFVFRECSGGIREKL